MQRLLMVLATALAVQALPAAAFAGPDNLPEPVRATTEAELRTLRAAATPLLGRLQGEVAALRDLQGAVNALTAVLTLDSTAEIWIDPEACNAAAATRVLCAELGAAVR